MDIQEIFQQSVASSKQLTRKPDNETLLQLYSLFKQATEGDMPADALLPGMFDFVAKAKYDAWKQLSGIPRQQAMEAYSALVDRLRANEQ